MNKDQVKGRFDEAVGKVKQGLGNANANPDQQDEGAGQELKGKIQKTFGDVKNDIAKAIDR